MNCWVHGALIFSPIFSPGKDGSVGWKGPSESERESSISLSLPMSAYLSAIVFSGFHWFALIFIKMVSSPWFMRFRSSCRIALTTSGSGFPHIEGDLSSPDHFCVEERRLAESDRSLRTVDFLSPLLFASSIARQAAPKFGRLEELPSSPLRS